jgi:hypothetical protein
MPSFLGKPGVFNLGTDRSIKIIDNNTSQAISFGGKYTNLTSKPKKKLVESNALDTYSDFRTTWDGHEGTITIDRANSDLERLMVQLEREYHQTGTEHFFTVQTTTYNQSTDSTEKFQYNYAVLMPDDDGDWKKDSTVPVKLTFHAREKVEL